MAQVNIGSFGYNESEEVTTDKSLDAGDCGVVQNVVETQTLTLPATVALRNYTIRVGAENITVAISPNSSDYIIGGGSTATTTNKDIIFTNQPAGSFVKLASGTAGWVITALLGTITYES